MSNTTSVTNRTIEVSAIDENYFMNTGLNVESVVFIPGAAGDVVSILETDASGPEKVKLSSDDGQPRVWYTNQRLQLGFVFADGTFSSGSKVIFNIGEIA